MRNVYRQFLELIPVDPLQVGTVQATAGNLVSVQLPGGAAIKARGVATVGQNVFVRGDAVEGPAPDLPIVLIEI
jgi:hypothetical protein